MDDESIEIRICKKCGKGKKLDKLNFQVNKQCVGGFRWDCKVCQAMYFKQRYDSIREEVRDQRKAKYWEDPDKARLNRRLAYEKQVSTAEGRLKATSARGVWKKNNIDKVRESGRRYQEKLRKENPEKVKRTWNKYYLSHQSEMIIKAHSRRVAGGIHYTVGGWNSRCIEFNNYCAYCLLKFPSNELTVEHFIPISRGGTNDISNIIPSCKTCNYRKNNKTPLEVVNGVVGIRIF